MSYDQRGRPAGAPRQGNDAGVQKGSVRAARERMQAAQQRNQLPDTSKIIGLPQRPNQLVSQYSQFPRSGKPPPPRLPETRDNVETVSPEPTPQWPLPNDTSSPVISPRSPKRRQPPPDSIRPESDELPIEQLSPEYPGNFPIPPVGYLQAPSSRDVSISYPNEDMLSPSSHRSSRPLTTSSAASESSSFLSIPEFPVPQPPMPALQQARRVPGLGPPPSSRRGPSSYYTQISYVSPITEESETRSDVLKSRHASFASSNVFPTNSDDCYQEDGIFSDDDETITSDRGGTISPAEPDERRSLVMKEASPALLRQASLGRRTKPSLMTIKSMDGLGDRKNGNGKNRPDGAVIGAGALGMGGVMMGVKAGYGQNDGSRQSPILSTSSSSSGSLSSYRNMKSIVPMSFESPTQQEHRSMAMGDRVGLRRPPKLDMDAVRDAEARGSLTSLPELIRRATRLAANLDRGKTASRLGLDFWEAGAPDRTRQSGLSDMLAAFPPPGQDTPVRTGTPNATNLNRLSKWPSAGINLRSGLTDSAMSNEKRKRRHKCCGMPWWTFVALLVVLLIAIAAAVVIPIVLVVIPNHNKGSSNAVQESQGNGNNNNNGGGNNNNNNNNNGNPPLPAPTLAPGNDQCNGVVTCQNGGISILNSDRTCNCVCINGFTGRTCTNNDATGCTTTTVPGIANNATMGTAISRLLGNTAGNFDIPLNSTRVLSLFSQLSLSCAAQNALITFNGLASRSAPQYLQPVNLRNTVEPELSLPILHNLHSSKTVKRQAIGEPGSRVTNEVKAAQPSATSTQPISSNPTALDFARVGVLFALQLTGDLETAAKVQEAIQNLLTSNRDGNAASSTINAGPFMMDLVQLTITFSNGTTIRAPPSPSAS